MRQLSDTPIRAVLLDMDGTLVDAFGPIISALNRTLADFSLPKMSDDEVRRHTGRGECSMISLFGEHREAASAHFLKYHDERLFDVQPMQGAAELLDWLAENNIARGIVTSKSQSRADKQLAHLGWSDKLDVVIGLCDGRRQKPDPHTVHLACEALNVPPAACIMVGDGIADMKSARRGGVLPIGLTHSFSNEELHEVGAKECFPSLPEVQTWLQAQLH
ncbi:MAG: HAD family hydrolase [Mariprofundaceae bacterium]|nr:HAD family hydrolase [Mariprofundaceae bacterium]